MAGRRGMRGSSPSLIGEVLGGALAGVGLERSLDDYRVMQAWERVVGPAIARSAQPLKLDGDTLVVVVRSSIWLQELSLLRKRILELLGPSTGTVVVRDLKLVVGKLEHSESGSREEIARALDRLSRR